MRVFRISVEAHAGNVAAAFNGMGGMYGMGRWHNTGRRIVYCGESLALAALESLVHIKRADKIQPYVHYEAEVPDALITNAPALPVGWQGAMPVTQAVGTLWLAAKSSPVMRVPSVLVGGSNNYLLNPEHPEFSLGWVVVGPVAFPFDGRLTKP